jgi:hypothetical protein
MASNLTLTTPTYPASKFGNGLAAGYGVAASLASSSALTVECWFKVASAGATEVIACQSGIFWMGLVGGKPSFTMEGSGSDKAQKTGATAKDDGNWHHMALSMGTTCVLYVDGVSVASYGVSLASTVSDFSKPFGVSTYTNTAPNFLFSGIVDEVAVWSTAKYTGAFTPATSAYTGAEANLLRLYHLDSDGADSAGVTTATATTLSGPTGGASGAASTNFTVGANGPIIGTFVVTPNDASGGGTFAPTSASINSASPTGTFTYTPASAGPKRIATTNDGSLTNPTAITYTASAAVVTIARNNAAIFYAPYVWKDDGTSVNANTTGAYLDFQFTGTSIILNTASLSGTLPKVRCFIDNGPPITIQLVAGTTAYPVVSGLAAGAHSIRLVTVALDQGTSYWTLAASVRVASFTLDTGASVSAVATRGSKRAIFFGDSIAQGASMLGAADGLINQDGTLSAPTIMAEALDAELGQVGYGGQGFAAAGGRGVPALNTAYALYSNGTSRLTGGVLSPAPDYVFCWHGTNGTPVQADVATSISNFRTIAPNAMIFMIVPPGGFRQSAITLATNAAITAGDAKVFLIDAGEVGQLGVNGVGSATKDSFDGLHPNQWKHARLASQYAALIQHILEPRRFTVAVS